jgi:ribulose-phosphate 3-epimerase
LRVDVVAAQIFAAPRLLSLEHSICSNLIKVAPSILSADFVRLGEEAQAAVDSGATGLRVDIMDGHFVPNLTIGPLVVASLRKDTRVPLDCHLMI